MVAGIDRYFQIARCFRDEDLRGDRQPEFTQLDLEMSFVDEATVMAFVEAMVIEVSPGDAPGSADPPRCRSRASPTTRRSSGSARDKPDLRFGMELVDLGPAWSDPTATPASGFRVFDDALAAGGRVKAIVAPGMAGVTRREIDELTERAKRFGAKGLVYLALEAGGEVKGPIAKFLGDETQRALIDADRRPTEGDLDPDRGRHAGGDRRRPGPAAGRAGRPARAGRSRTSSPTAGSTASRCTSGMPRAAAGTRPTTRSAASCPRTRSCS